MKVAQPAEAAGRERCTLGDACPTRLKCELARECLPQDTPDPNVKFAWANAICALFAVIGLVGLFQPLIVLPVSAVVQKPFTVPVLFNPPPPQPSVAQSVPNNSAPQEATAEPMETPDIVPAVTPMTAQVAFAVPVEGPVRLVAAKYAVPPPAKLKPAPAPSSNNGAPGESGNVVGDAVAFEPTLGDGGTYPWPDKYPYGASPNWSGIVTLAVRVNAAGVPYEVTVQKRSRYRIFDNHALEWLKKNWRWPVGPERFFTVNFKYKSS